jgi:quercetin dioxygenase-like cupin family protein
MKRVQLVGGLTEKVLRVVRSKKKWAAATVGVAVIGTLAAAVVLGSDPFHFTPTTFTTRNLVNNVQENSDRVKFQTKDPTDVRVQRVDIAAGGYSGWHHHPGIVIVAVESGTVTYTRADCSSTTYGFGLPAGSVFVEAGDEPAQASSADGATLYATFVAPHVNPPAGPIFRIEDAEVFC